MSTSIKSVMPTKDPIISKVLKCHSVIFIPNIPVRRVSGSINAEKVVRYLIVVLLSSSNILLSGFSIGK